MSKKMDILTTLSKGIYKDDNYSVVDKQVVSMINEYYRRFKQDITFQGRMNITILSLDNLDGDKGEDLRWKKIKEALPDVYDKDFVDFTLINCRNMQEIESSFVDHIDFVWKTYKSKSIVISNNEIIKEYANAKADCSKFESKVYFIKWYNTKEEWEKSRIKTANYEDNLKIDDSVVAIDFDSLKDRINPYDIQKILNYRKVNHKGKLTFVISDNHTVQEMYDILGLPYNYYKYVSVIGEDSDKTIKEAFQETIKKFKSSFISMNEQFLKKCETQDVSKTIYTITNKGITLVKKASECAGSKEQKLLNAIKESDMWEDLLKNKKWKNAKQEIINFEDMSNSYITNCIAFLRTYSKYTRNIPISDYLRAFRQELNTRKDFNKPCRKDKREIAERTFGIYGYDYLKNCLNKKLWLAKHTREDGTYEIPIKDMSDSYIRNCIDFLRSDSLFVKRFIPIIGYKERYDIVNKYIKLFKDVLKNREKKNELRLSRPYFGVKSDKIEHKAALSQRWYFLLQENMWRDKNGNRHFIPNMPENYIKNCLLWLDETLCGKYIPDPELRRKFKSLFQNELSHRDTLNRLSLYDLTDLYVNYRKNHENEDLLNKYSQILYSKPFCETAASEKVHIFKSIEADEKLKKEKRVMKIHKKDDYTALYLCVDDSVVYRIEPHYEDGHLVGGSQYTINPKKDDDAYNNLLKEFENEPYLTSNIITEKELLDGKKFQDLHSQMAIKCGIDVNDLPSMTTRRTDAQKYMVEKITNDLKAFGTEEVIKHYQNMSAIEKPSYYWKELERITSPINSSTEIPIKVRMMLNIIAHNNYKKIYEDKVGKESGRWSASEHNYNDLEKNVKKQKAYGTKYWNMSYDELVKQGLWKDADNNIYTISSMRNGHIANIMDMLNTGKYQLDMSPETKEKYKDLFLDEFRIRNALKNSEPLFLSKEEPQFLFKEEHNNFHGFGKKENDVINSPSHYLQNGRKFEPIAVINDWKLSYNVGNCLKYLSRAGAKDDIKQDMNKAVFYLLYECKMLGLTKEQILKTVESIFEKR